jgi:Co/Zn/Cd efflux system component
MSAHCQDHCTPAQANAPAYRKVLWIALVVNALMWAVEIYASAAVHSVALLADSIDFFADAANYAITLVVLGMAGIWRTRAAVFKALCMLGIGIFVFARAAWLAYSGSVPEPMAMGAVGALALAANLGVAALLYAYRDGDANMRSVWLCTRNDALGNVAVILAAAGVLGTGSRWPDLIVAAGMAALSISAAISVLRQAKGEGLVQTESAIQAAHHHHPHH